MLVKGASAFYSHDYQSTKDDNTIQQNKVKQSHVRNSGKYGTTAISAIIAETPHKVPIAITWEEWYFAHTRTQFIVLMRLTH